MQEVNVYGGLRSYLGVGQRAPERWEEAPRRAVRIKYPTLAVAPVGVVVPLQRALPVLGKGPLRVQDALDGSVTAVGPP
jgi:hypothetical protein